ncbi:MAG: hypothetical protein M3O61_19970, partial [Gemmatimonadota bacterium]|nr:hypothetical protein [Gemmatimonadota bacterium]
LTSESGASLDFLGYTFRYEWDRFGRNRRYLTAVPSVKAVAREREEMRAMIGARQSHVPMPALIARVNRQLRGWGQYYSIGHPRRAHRDMNAFVVARLTKHLRRRSQRACRPPAGMSYYSFLTGRLSLDLL